MKIKLVANRKVRLDKYISDNSDLSREQINKIIEQKNCLVDGSPALKKSQMIDIDNTIIIDTKDNLEQNNDLTLDYEYIDEDIIVYPGIQHRTFDTQYLQCIDLSDFVKKKILTFSRKYSLISKEYDVIHLRGGSKKWMGGKLPHNSLVKESHNKWNNADEYMDFLYKKYILQRLEA